MITYALQQVSGGEVALPEDALRQEKERARGAQPADGKRGWVVG